MNKTPKRIWGVSIILLIKAAISLWATGFLLVNPELMSGIGFSVPLLLLGVILPIYLFISVVRLVKRDRQSKKAIITASCLFMGMIILQNIIMVVQNDLSQEQEMKAFSTIVNNLITLVIVFWVMYSLKVRKYLED